MLLVPIKFFENNFLEDSLKISACLRPCKEEEPQTILQKFKDNVLREGSKNPKFSNILDTENIFRGPEDHILEDPEHETHFLEDQWNFFRD